MDKAELARRIKAVSYMTGEFRLRSAKTSPFFWDKYRFESDPVQLSAVVDELEELLPPEFDKLAGLELGGIMPATALSLKTGKPCLYIRKTPKSYGTCNLVEGGFPASGSWWSKTVITTGGQVYKSVMQMQAQGLAVEHAACVVDCFAGRHENLERIGCTLTPLFTLDELEQLAQGGQG